MTQTDTELARAQITGATRAEIEALNIFIGIKKDSLLRELEELKNDIKRVFEETALELDRISERLGEAYDA